MVHPVPGRDQQAACQRLVRRDGLEGEDPVGVGNPLGGELLPQAVELGELLLDLPHRHKGAAALLAVDVPVLLQPLEGVPHGDAADPVLRAQLPFGQNLVVRLPAAGIHLFHEGVVELLIFVLGSRFLVIHADSSSLLFCLCPDPLRPPV